MIGLIGMGFWLLSAVAETRYSRTPGKKLMGLHVVCESGTRIGFGQAIVRQLPVFLQIFLIDALFALFTERHQRAFELLSRTRTVRDAYVETHRYRWRPAGSPACPPGLWRRSTLGRSELGRRAGRRHGDRGQPERLVDGAAPVGRLRVKAPAARTRATTASSPPPASVSRALAPPGQVPRVPARRARVLARALDQGGCPELNSDPAVR
jgi:hypothetical protein